jgi:hypothetical protein
MSEQCPFDQNSCRIIPELETQTRVYQDRSLRPGDPRANISPAVQNYINRINRVRGCASHPECQDISTLEERVKQLQDQVNQK